MKLWFDTSQVFIAGRWQAPSGGDTLPMMDPSTGNEIGRIARGTSEDIDAAVAAAGGRWMVRGASSPPPSGAGFWPASARWSPRTARRWPRWRRPMWASR
jgi:hypothetical protein